MKEKKEKKASERTGRKKKKSIQEPGIIWNDVCHLGRKSALSTQLTDVFLNSHIMTKTYFEMNKVQGGTRNSPTAQIENVFCNERGNKVGAKTS